MSGYAPHHYGDDNLTRDERGTPRDPEGLCPPDDTRRAFIPPDENLEMPEPVAPCPSCAYWAGHDPACPEPMKAGARPSANYRSPRTYELNQDTMHELIGQRLLELDRKVRDFNTKVVRATLEGATAKVGHEAVEFLSHPDKEAKDVLITLLGWVGVSGHDVLWLIEQAIAKMEINEGRRWVQQPDGSWQHTEDGTS